MLLDRARYPFADAVMRMQNSGLAATTATSMPSAFDDRWRSSLHTTAPQTRHGRTHFGLARGVPHMGCPVGEAAGRADPTGQKSHRLLTTKPGHGCPTNNPGLGARQPHPGPGMQRASHAGPLIMATHARQAVHVPDDVDALHVGQDIPGLCRISSAPALSQPFLPNVGRVVIGGGHGLARG